MAFPWDTLITAVSVGGASLGGIWLRARYDDRAQERQAMQAGKNFLSEQQREAYYRLVVAARVENRHFRQLRDEGDAWRLASDHSSVEAVAKGVSEAVATVELFGSDRARTHAAALYKRATEAEDWFRLQALHGPAAESFDNERADELCHSLAQAIDDFLDAVRPEFTADSL